MRRRTLCLCSVGKPTTNPGLSLGEGQGQEAMHLVKARTRNIRLIPFYRRHYPPPPPLSRLPPPNPSPRLLLEGNIKIKIPRRTGRGQYYTVKRTQEERGLGDGIEVLPKKYIQLSIYSEVDTVYCMYFTRGEVEEDSFLSRSLQLRTILRVQEHTGAYRSSAFLPSMAELHSRVL